MASSSPHRRSTSRRGAGGIAGTRRAGRRPRPASSAAQVPQPAAPPRASSVGAPAPLRAMSVALGELAVRFGCELRGDPDVRVARRGNRCGRPGPLSFLANPKLASPAGTDTRRGRGARCRERRRLSRAALISPIRTRCLHGSPALLHPAAAAARRYPSRAPSRCRPPSIDPSSEIGAHAVVAAGAHIGARCIIGPACLIGRGRGIGAGLPSGGAGDPGRAACSWAARVLIHPGAVHRRRWLRLRARRHALAQGAADRRRGMGDDVEIGANTTIDRGAIGDTVIGRRRQARQPDPDWPQRPDRCAYRDRRLHRSFRQHAHRRALHDRRCAAASRATS